MRGLLITWLMMLIPGWAGDVLEWDRLPDLPDKEGFAGVFAGVVSEGGEDFLVVAGGANFPEGRPQGVWLAGLFLDGGCGFDEFH